MSLYRGIFLHHHASVRVLQQYPPCLGHLWHPCCLAGGSMHLRLQQMNTLTVIASVSYISKSTRRDMLYNEVRQCKRKYHRETFIFHLLQRAMKHIKNSPQSTSAQPHDRHILQHIFYILFKQEVN